MKDQLWAATLAFTKAEFQDEMMTLNCLSEKAYPYLKEVDLALWLRSHFPSHSRLDLLVNKFSECFNAYILDVHDKPIITMMEVM